MTVSLAASTSSIAPKAPAGGRQPESARALFCRVFGCPKYVVELPWRIKIAKRVEFSMDIRNYAS
ncbi:hypothetical protein LPJGGPFB_04426 [Ensifer adhaerens]|nr:hypothetical protein [Ensifer adhaerens]